MTLAEMSVSYQDSERTIRNRIRELQEETKHTEDPEVLWHLRRRMAELQPILRETRELALLTAHYYDRSYHKHERYTI